MTTASRRLDRAALSRVPSELLAGAKCVGWRWETRKGKPTKPPITPSGAPST